MRARRKLPPDVEGLRILHGPTPLEHAALRLVELELRRREAVMNPKLHEELAHAVDQALCDVDLLLVPKHPRKRRTPRKRKGPPCPRTKKKARRPPSR